MAAAADLAYMAGLFDGEGSIVITFHPGHRRSHKLQINVVNTCEDVLWLFRRFGGHIGKRTPKGGKRVCYVWQADGRAAEQMLRQLVPYLRIKYHQARLALEFRDLGQAKGQRISATLYDARQRLRERIQIANRGK